MPHFGDTSKVNSIPSPKKKILETAFLIKMLKII
jgi:hypothetical protein